MRYVLFLVAVACGTATTPSAPPAAATEAGAKAGQRSDTDVAGLEKALAEGAQLIDVRTEGEFATGHVPGAVNVPLGFGLDDPRIQSLDAEAPVYVICQSGGRSARAADQLVSGGFSAVNVKGGTGAWQASSREIAK
jgi:rhodanese-related sulfurtransferase